MVSSSLSARRDEKESRHALVFAVLADLANLGMVQDGGADQAQPVGVFSGLVNGRQYRVHGIDPGRAVDETCRAEAAAVGAAFQGFHQEGVFEGRIRCHDGGGGFDAVKVLKVLDLDLVNGRASEGGADEYRMGE
jgi:hypothetical protein